MRCQSCNGALTDEESTQKDPSTGEYVDVCSRCTNTLLEDLGMYESDYDLLDSDDWEWDYDYTTGDQGDGR
jgi:hypothetical protein